MEDSQEWPGGSNVRKATYNVKTETLTVYFAEATYQYSGVDMDTWGEIKNSDSGGKAVHKYIIGKFQQERI